MKHSHSPLQNLPMASHHHENKTYPPHPRLTKSQLIWPHLLTELIHAIHPSAHPHAHLPTQPTILPSLPLAHDTPITLSSFPVPPIYQLCPCIVPMYELFPLTARLLPILPETDSWHSALTTNEISSEAFPDDPIKWPLSRSYFNIHLF